jgi:[glutamine synthetase] adenylyltransferase / [glutamine synthetase]-adenylyl-L-tyrosine phosphorylase
MTRTHPVGSSALDPDGLAAQSRYMQRLARRYSSEWRHLAPGPITAPHLTQAFQALQAQGLDTPAALRVLRQLVVARLLTLDCEQAAPLDVVTTGMTLLAEFALDLACTQVFAELDALHGAPCNAHGVRPTFWVVGMGKLGARELNVSSDIDLIYVYDSDGETLGDPQGRGRISTHEYFAKAVRALYALVGETSEHGFVFRVDLALRPNGNSGPTALSLGALEEYFQVQGREWERLAWLKSRVVAPASSRDGDAARALRAVVLPFVFRRYLDYSVFESLRDLHRQIREHATRRSAGRPERSNDIKLSRGGIREIEFIAQLLQVVRGGQFPELRRRATLEALPCLARAGLMPPATAQALAEAYTFLRRVEHRIQYLDDQQTHTLPTNDEDLLWIAQTMGYDNCRSLLVQLDIHREMVAQEFDTLLGGKTACKGCKKAGIPPQAGDLEALLAQAPEPLARRLRDWQDSPRVRALRDEARSRLQQLLQRTLVWLQQEQTDVEACLRLLDWLEPLLRRESYLALLLELPAVHQRLLRLLGAARWPARYLLQHPGVVDELADSRMLDERFMPAEFEQELEQRLRALQAGAQDDDENLLNLLRRAHHAEQFRTLARDVEGRLSVEAVADELSALADTVLRVTARWCWQRLKNRHRENPQFGVIGYGKLGSKELGYGSDLDIVFVYDDAHEQAPEIYAGFARKLINWLSVKTGEGDLFEIDTALRPNGNSGLLVSRFEAFADYQQQRGSNTAWTWEHQAMTRARFVLGEDSLRTRFETVRTAVITAPRDPNALAQEVVRMSERVRAAHPVRAQGFDLKYSRGGMVDAEFVVQFLVLSQSATHPELRDNVGHIALLHRAENAGLLPAGLGQASASAYRELRQLQHRARMDERSTQFDAAHTPACHSAILALWSAVFEAGKSLA